MRNTEIGISCESARFIGAHYGKFTPFEPRWYDDGFGPVWFYQDASGLIGLIRAQSFEDAWNICEDEIFDDADTEALASDSEGMSEDDGLPEGYGFRPSGSGSNKWNQTGIYSEDLNGSSLRLLTHEDMERHGIVLHWAEWDGE